MITLDLIMFAALIAAILSGFPVAFSIAGIALIFGTIGSMTGVMDFGLFGALGQRFFSTITNEVLIAIPLFVFMGAVLEKSEIAADLLETMGRQFRSLRGGLGVSVILVGALLAASTGIVGATVTAMGLIALPTMLKNGYDPKLAAGIVCTAGTLGQIIPPSTMLIILSDVMSNAFQQAQYAQGKFSIETISVGQIFAAALVPGLLLVSIYIVYVLGYAFLNPKVAPGLAVDEKPSFSVVFGALVPPVLLILAVLGSILGGIATPTEAASVGAVGAILLTAWKLKANRLLVIGSVLSLGVLAVAAGVYPVRLQRSDIGIGDWVLAGVYLLMAAIIFYGLFAGLTKSLKTGMLVPAVTSSLTVTTMIFATILAASMFSLVFVGLGGDETMAAILEQMPGGPTGALIFCMVLIFILGFFIDFVEITVIVLPVTVPILIAMGHDPIWLAILIAINLQTSFLTPPFGFSLFYLRGAAPKEITTAHIYGVLLRSFFCRSSPSRSSGYSLR